MPQYFTDFRARVLQRLVGPEAISANRAVAEVGVPQSIFSWWLASARSGTGLRCIEVVVPENASLDYMGHSSKCDRGFRRRNANCESFEIPANARVDNTGAR
ncbi:MAG: hypothetical protein U5K74_12985 [Gemmatimonadaceae bacterium]|nr:hypothetical protein [Gemmatimonadaceae bacterium]